MTPDELKALADAATPGPWRADGDDVVFGLHDEGIAVLFHGAILYDAVEQGPRDAQLAALAPDLARLCAEMGEALERIWESAESNPPHEAADVARDAFLKLAELKSSGAESPYDRANDTSAPETP